MRYKKIEIKKLIDLDNDLFKNKDVIVDFMLKLKQEGQFQNDRHMLFVLYETLEEIFGTEIAVYKQKIKVKNNQLIRMTSEFYELENAKLNAEISNFFAH